MMKLLFGNCCESWCCWFLQVTTNETLDNYYSGKLQEKIINLLEVSVLRFCKFHLKRKREFYFKVILGFDDF